MLRLIFITIILFALTACTKLTRENFDQVKVGMSYQEVSKILGEADKCDKALGAMNCVWGDDKKNITIKFVADKVVLPTAEGI